MYAFSEGNKARSFTGNVEFWTQSISGVLVLDYALGIYKNGCHISNSVQIWIWLNVPTHFFIISGPNDVAWL